MVAGGGPTALLTGYRYLRLSMVAVLLMLAVAVIFEVAHPSHAARHVDNDGHILSSISAYYWTSVKPVFVATLVALGVGMIVLKPESEVEDVLLNLAGALAPIVAFVPTPLPDVCGPNQDGACPLPLRTTESITNNIVAFLVAGLIGLVMFVAVVIWGPDDSDGSRWRRRAWDTVKKVRTVGVALMALGLIAFAAWALADHESFWRHAHLTAAPLMFGCIIVVTVLNAIRKYVEVANASSPVGRLDRCAELTYIVLAVVMVVGLLVCGGIKLLGVDFDQNFLVLEIVVLGSFLGFWAIQTVELWSREPDLPLDRRVWGFRWSDLTRRATS